MNRHPVQTAIVGLCAAFLTACIGPAPAPGTTDAASAPASKASGEPAVTPASRGSEPAPVQPTQAATAASFAAPPAVGWIIRSNCRMGGCNWMRVDQVMRSGSDEAPVYDLRVTLGDSRHAQDPYPLRPDGVEITWQPAPVAAQVKCSRSAPYAMADGQSERLKLDPQGVAGASQGLANLYFASCHGEYGDDAALARKFGYELR